MSKLVILSKWNKEKKSKIQNHCPFWSSMQFVFGIFVHTVRKRKWILQKYDVIGFQRQKGIVQIKDYLFPSTIADCFLCGFVMILWPLKKDLITVKAFPRLYPGRNHQRVQKFFSQVEIDWNWKKAIVDLGVSLPGAILPPSSSKIGQKIMAAGITNPSQTTFWIRHRKVQSISK